MKLRKQRHKIFVARAKRQVADKDALCWLYVVWVCCIRGMRLVPGDGRVK